MGCKKNLDPVTVGALLPPMADEPDIDPNEDPTSTQAQDAESAINAPDLDGDVLDTEARSISNVAQAAGICSDSEAKNRARAQRAFIVQQVADGAAPYSFAARLQTAKSWMNNFSTNWLAGLNQPLRMRLQNAVVTADVLTYSQLPDTVDDWSEKTDLLQMGQSNVLRNWDNFSDFLSAVSGDTALQGYCYAVFLDPWTPFPTFFKLEDARVPERSKMNPSELQWFCADWDYPVQDFIALFKDEEAAEAAGYNVENCNEAANKATVDQESNQANINKPRRFAEMITEGAIGVGYGGGGQRIVKCWLFWSVEYDGKVTIWLIDRDTKKLLRLAVKEFPSMGDVLQIFSFEGGNSCIHSSKGIGRVLINQALAIEKNRCRMFDSMGLASFLILQADVAARNRLDISINAPFVLIDSNAKVQPQTFQSGWEGYIAIDRFLTSAAQQAAGVWINDIINPATSQGDKTATEAKIENARGQESAVMFISRFMDKWHGLCGVSQRRAWSDDNLQTALGIFRKILDDPSKDRQALYQNHVNVDAGTLREIVGVFKKWPGGVDPDNKDATAATLDEIAVWRDSPAAIRAHVLDNRYDQGIQQIYAEQGKGANPGIDQVELLKLRTQQVAGEQYAKRILIPTPSQTVTAEAARAQEIENATMSILQQAVPVSPRDNWQVHGQVVITALQQLTANPPPTALKYTELLADHLGQHLQQAMTGGQAGNELFKQMDEFYKAFTKDIKAVVVMRAHAQTAAKAIAQHLGPAGAGAGQTAAALGQAPGIGAQPDPGPAGAAPAAVAPPMDLKEYVNVAFKDLDPFSQQQFLQMIGLPPSPILAKEIAAAMAVPAQATQDAAKTAAQIQQGQQQTALQAQGQQADSAQQAAQLQLQAQAQATASAAQPQPTEAGSASQ